MKKIQATLLVALFTAALTFTITAQAAPAGDCTAVRVEGIVQYSLDGTTWSPLVAGKLLPAGSTIRTGDDGMVDLILGKAIDFPQARWAPQRISYAADSPVRGLVSYKPSAEQNVIRLTYNTTLSIDKLTTVDTGADTVNDTELNLKSGKIFASVKKFSAASQYVIKIPNGIAGVRGTRFSLSDSGELVVFQSLEGAQGGVVESINGGPAVFIPEGYYFNPVGGGGGGLTPTPTLHPQPIPPAVFQQYEKIFAALRTLYFQIINFSYDHNGGFVSPISGNPGVSP
jgi:hypothetical protein